MPKSLHALGIRLSVIVACCLLTACAAPQCDRGIPDLLPGKTLGDVDTSLRSGEPCAPPCWQGLTPGESTATDAIDVLKSLSFVQEDSILRRDLGALDRETIDWHSSVSNGGSGYIILNSEDKIASIVIDLEYKLTLQELIDGLGEPDAFSVLHNPPTCQEVSVVWLDAGLTAWPTIVSTRGDNPLIEPERTIRTVEYSAPATTLEEFFAKLRYDNAESRQGVLALFADWTGFDDVRYSTIYPDD